VEEGVLGDYYDFLFKAIDASVVKRKFRSVETQQWMLHRYETDYGIYNHDQADPTKYYSLVAFHETEDLSIGDLLYERLEQYMEAGVKQYTGLSFNEFMDYPRHMVLRILERCRQRQAKAPTLDLDNL